MGAHPAIHSAYAGTPGCWSAELANPLEVQVATSGLWDGKVLNMKGTFTGNHAKIGHSLGGSLAVMGDMNQQGSYSPDERSCSSSQNGRGGIFFVVDDAVLHSSLQKLMTGDTASYDASPPSPPRRRAPSPASTFWLRRRRRGCNHLPHERLFGAGLRLRLLQDYHHLRGHRLGLLSLRLASRFLSRQVGCDYLRGNLFSSVILSAIG